MSGLSVSAIVKTDSAKRNGDPGPRRLLLKHHWRPADSLPMEVHGHLDSVSDLDERNAAVHTVVFSIKCHCLRNRTLASSSASNCKSERLGLCHSAYRKIALQVKGGGASLNNLC
jgi:hypothetical protein